MDRFPVRQEHDSQGLIAEFADSAPSTNPPVLLHHFRNGFVNHPLNLFV
ncbi:MAG TPA: hypothetical protein VKO18_01400 [Terriglobia bacterium]|nr:hypothetical protein [Terriglobia bacterium]